MAEILIDKEYYTNLLMHYEMKGFELKRTMNVHIVMKQARAQNAYEQYKEFIENKNIIYDRKNEIAFHVGILFMFLVRNNPFDTDSDTSCSIYINCFISLLLSFFIMKDYCETSAALGNPITNRALKFPGSRTTIDIIGTMIKKINLRPMDIYFIFKDMVDKPSVVRTAYLASEKGYLQASQKFGDKH